jgi:hypothetical protein
MSKMLVREKDSSNEIQNFLNPGKVHLGWSLFYSTFFKQYYTYIEIHSEHVPKSGTGRGN